MKHYPDGEVRREYWCCPTSGRGGCGRIAIDQRALDAHAAELAIAVLSDAELANAAHVNLEFSWTDRPAEANSRR